MVMMSLNKWTLKELSSGGTSVVATTSNQGEEPVEEPQLESYDYTFANSLVRGVPHPQFIDPQGFEAQQKALRFRKGDIFVSTYSKCGTTLTEQIVLLLLNGGDATDLNPLHKNTLDCASKKGPPRIGKVWPEMAVVDGLQDCRLTSGGPKKACMGEGKARMSVQEFDELPSPRILKSHEPMSLFLGANNHGSLVDGIKVIYVTRNPFDACVSCYYHPKPGVSPATTGCSFDAFCKLWLSDRVEFGGWIQHVKGWYQQYKRSTMGQEDKQILWISYESLVGQPHASIRRIAEFLEVPSNDALVDRVATGCNFKSVKDSALKLIANGAQGDVSHLRKGKVGDWKNHFSVELREQFEAEVRRQLMEDSSTSMDLLFDIGEGKPWRVNPEPEHANLVAGVHMNSTTTTKAKDSSIDADTVRMVDIKTLGLMMIFMNILNTSLTYASEFYLDDVREENGLEDPTDFPLITLVVANIFNGVSGGLALATAVFSGRLVRQVWGPRLAAPSFCFFVSILLESLVTSGVLHSVAHKFFGTTFAGNGWVEVLAHLGYTINVIASSLCLLLWQAPGHLQPKWHQIIVATVVATLAACISFLWLPYEPDPEDFDFPEDQLDESEYDRIVLMQGTNQPAIEAVLLIPTVLFLFAFLRLWKDTTTNGVQGTKDTPLQITFLRVGVMASVVPLTLNWIHFRCHDSLTHGIQEITGWDHSMTIAAIRILFHIPNWVLGIGRIHYFRRYTEAEAGWPSADITRSLFPGGEIFPFAMVFLYRMSEGATLSLLPAFFRDHASTSLSSSFVMDITDNTWLACTVLAMFLANAIGSVGLGGLMQRKGYRFTYIFMGASWLFLFPLFLFPQTEWSLFVVRFLAALVFPGPAVLSRITQRTRTEYQDSFKHVPMLTTLVWFNQGFALGGAISNSSVWTPWNVFFTSFLVLTILASILLTAFLVFQPKEQSQPEPQREPLPIQLPDKDPILDSSSSSSLRLEKSASFLNGCSFACHVALLGIQVTQLVDLDYYEYAAIVSSLGSLSTVLILASYRVLARNTHRQNMALAFGGHLLGTAVLGIPHLYDQEWGVVAVVASYGCILLSFFVMNLSCEVSLAEKSDDAAKGKQMGYIKSSLSVGKVVGSLLVVLGFRIHPQAPLWILEGGLAVAALLVWFVTSAFPHQGRPTKETAIMDETFKMEYEWDGVITTLYEV